MSLWIGITGGIASGKSTVGKYLRELGYIVIDSDDIVKDLLASNEEVISSIQASFPDAFENGQLQKSQLAQIIFSDEKKRATLNRIIHPLVKETILQKAESYKDKQEIIFIDIPLLYEAKFEDVVDLILVVYVDYQTQIERLMKRDQIDKKYAMKKIASQLSLEIKKKRADFVIHNTQTEAETRKELLEMLVQLTKGRKKNEI